MQMADGAYEAAAHRPSVDLASFRDAMARFASGVTVVTTLDDAGRPHGFTASSFTSLSHEPPLVLVCLANSARCYSAFMTAGQFGVFMLRQHQWAIGARFASKDLTDKFVDGAFDYLYPVPHLSDALSSVICRVHDRVQGGDHTILIGEVLAATYSDGEPIVFFNRRQWRIVADTVEAS
jgi:flavin reductase ActVB